MRKFQTKSTRPGTIGPGFTALAKSVVTYGVAELGEASFVVYVVGRHGVDELAEAGRLVLDVRRLRDGRLVTRDQIAETDSS